MSKVSSSSVSSVSFALERGKRLTAEDIKAYKVGNAKLRAKAAAKAKAKAAEERRLREAEEREAARQRRHTKKIERRDAKRLNKPQLPGETSREEVVTLSHVEELRRRGWLKNRVKTPPLDEGKPEEAIKVSTVSTPKTKWEKREYAWQQMLSFLRAKYGVPLTDLTLEEWESKQLHPERVKKLGLRSPKLSKAMVALGVPQQEVAILLGASYAKKHESAMATKILDDRDSCEEQGNSIYYKSCQATDRRAQWQAGDDYHCFYEEFKYMGTDLFLWVVGEPMSVNGEGFEARAKIRVMYKDRGCTTPAGLYIDRPYGKYSLLLDNINELIVWWQEWCEAKGLGKLPILMPPVWNRENGAGNDFQRKYGGRYHTKLFCRSACGGYQDTLTHKEGGYDFFVDISAAQESILISAYRKRSKFGGVYYSPLRDVKYNPQKWDVVVPQIELPNARGVITDKYRELYQIARNYFSAERFEAVGEEFFFFKNGQRFEIVAAAGGRTIINDEFHNNVFNIKPHYTQVVEDNENLGVVEASPIPYVYRRVDGVSGLYVEANTEEGFWVAHDIEVGQTATKLFHAYSGEHGCIWSTTSERYRCDTALDAHVVVCPREGIKLYSRDCCLSLKKGVVHAEMEYEAIDLHYGRLFVRGLEFLGIKDPVVSMGWNGRHYLQYKDIKASLPPENVTFFSLLLFKGRTSVLEVFSTTEVHVDPRAHLALGAGWDGGRQLVIRRGTYDHKLYVDPHAYENCYPMEKQRLQKLGIAPAVNI